MTEQDQTSEAGAEEVSEAKETMANDTAEAESAAKEQAEEHNEAQEK